VEAETRTRIAAVEQMRHADRLSIVGRLASGVAHELGTPLNVALAHARLIARQQRSVDGAADANVIVEQGERMAGIIRQLLDLARRHTPNKRLEDVRSIVSGTLAVIEPVASKHGVVLQTHSGAQPIVANVDPEQMRQVVANLVMNAIQAQPAGGEVRVHTEELDSCQMRIRVEDKGSGIPSDALDRIFEPFFTTKEPGDGTGLGLTVSYGIVSDHGGRIEVESRQGLGSTFSVYLPLERSGTAAATP
jgi:signal transduction histidine kinase